VRYFSPSQMMGFSSLWMTFSSFWMNHFSQTIYFQYSKKSWKYIAMPYLVKITPARDGVHKYVALFKLHEGGFKSVPFGASGMSDFTKHKDPERMKRYLDRHRANEDWNDPMSAGALSRWILWSAPSIVGGIRNYRKHFNM